LCCFPLQLSPSVLWYCWLGLLTCKNRLPYNLYCVGGDVKHCPTNQSINSQFNGSQFLFVYDQCLSVTSDCVRSYVSSNTPEIETDQSRLAVCIPVQVVTRQIYSLFKIVSDFAAVATSGECKWNKRINVTVISVAEWCYLWDSGYKNRTQSRVCS